MSIFVNALWASDTKYIMLESSQEENMQTKKILATLPPHGIVCHIFQIYLVIFIVGVLFSLTQLKHTVPRIS